MDLAYVQDGGRVHEWIGDDGMLRRFESFGRHSVTSDQIIGVIMKRVSLFGTALATIFVTVALSVPASISTATHGGPIYTLVGPVPVSAAVR